jgi:hypothetical protein
VLRLVVRDRIELSTFRFSEGGSFPDGLCREKQESPSASVLTGQKLAASF